MDDSLDKIIKACLKNDRRAQEQLYKKYFSKMLSMVLRYTSDKDRALMIVNDGFLKVFKNLKSFEGRGSLEAWIRKLVFNCLSDFFRKENKYLRLIITEEKESKHSEPITAKLYYDDLITLIKKLPEKAQKVFTLYAIEGFNHKEIADLLQMSEGTSKWYLSEARKTLRKMIASPRSSINHAG